VEDSPADLGRYGLDAPRVRAVLTTEDGDTRTLLIGAEGPARQLEDREVRRYYAAVEGEPAVYLVDRGPLDVCQDLIREHGRKAERDEDIERSHDAMKQEMADRGEEEETP
jgi:hypothetical protein